MAGLALIFPPECPDGTYGSNCSQQCGQGCDPPDSCDKENGGCVCVSDNWETGRCAGEVHIWTVKVLMTDVIVVLYVVAKIDLAMGL